MAATPLRWSYSGLHHASLELGALARRSAMAGGPLGRRRQPALPLMGLALDPMSTGLPFRFEPQGAAPLYLQLAQVLEQALRDELLGPALPSERVLAQALSLSRVTARRAIDRLVERGLVLRRRGSGNYVAPRWEAAGPQLSSFSEALRRRGFEPSSRWLRRSRALANADEQQALNLPPRSPVLRLERLRLADGRPMALERSVLPGGLLAADEAQGPSLYALLAARGLRPVRATQRFVAINADARQAELLQVPLGQALLRVTRLATAADGRPLEWTRSDCRSDRFEFVTPLWHDADPQAASEP